MKREAQVNLAGKSVSFELRASWRRRSIGLTVSPDDGLVVYIPATLSGADLGTFLQAKGDWILKKLEAAEIRRSNLVRPDWRDGILVPYRGSPRRLSVQSGTSLSGWEVCLSEERLLVRPMPPSPETPQREQLVRHGSGVNPSSQLLFDFAADGKWSSIPDGGQPLTGERPIEKSETLRGDNLRAIVLRWLRRQARAVITARVDHFEERVGLHSVRIRIKDQRSRWGSCSALGGLNFNWRLIMAPGEVLEYVVAHEIVHLAHLNHSRQFWSLLESHLPHYRQPRLWLKDHGRSLRQW